MKTASPFTPAERLESLKTATVGGTSAGLLSLGLWLGQHWFSQGDWPPLTTLFSSLSGLALLVNGAIAVLSGTLFALTYRYAIRQDHNPQLNAGVVLAFTLVRGLAQVEAGSAIVPKFWPVLAACGESLLIFGGSAIVLTLAFQRRWLQPFGDSSS